MRCLLPLLALVAGTVARAADDGLLWRADFAQGAAAFEVRLEEGAEGDVVFTPTGVSVRKTSEAGYVVVQAKVKVAAAPGSRVAAFASVESQDADPNYSVAGLRLLGDDGRLTLKAAAGLTTFAGGGARKNRLINTPPGKPMRTFTLAKLRGPDTPEKDYDSTPFPEGGVFPALVVAGPPSTSVWSDWTLADFDRASADWKRKAQQAAAPYAQDLSAAAIPEGELSARLAREVDHVAKVERRDGVARLVVDGSEALPVFYRERGRGELPLCAAKPMYDAGVRLSVSSVRFDTGYDVTGAVEHVRREMRLSPDSLFLVGLQVDPPTDFVQAHLDEAWRKADGSIVYGQGCHYTKLPHPETRTDCRPWISMQSETWFDRTTQHIAAIVAELKRTGLSRRVVGVHLNGFHDGQFSAVVPDYSAPSERAWRRYLRAWHGEQPPDWTMPTPVDYAPDGKASEFLDPVRDRRLADFLKFRYRSAFAVQDRLGLAVKRFFGKEVVVIKWCMGGFTGHEDSSYDFNDFVRCAGIDILVAQSTYGQRVPGVPLAEKRVPASFHLHGKLYVDEIDFRSWTRVPATDELSAWGLGWTPEPATWQTLHRRRVGQMFALGCGFWYYDLSGRMFAAPEMLADIREVTDFGRKLMAQKPSAWRPSVLVALDEDGVLLRNLPGRRKMPDEIALVDEQLSLLESAGVPFELFLADDLVRDPSVADGARLVVFIGLREIDAGRRQLLQRLQQAGKTVVHTHGAGWLGGLEATGFRLRLDMQPSDHVVVPAAGYTMDDARNYLVTARLRESVNGKRGEWASWKFWRPFRFVIEADDGVKPIARYADNGELAIAERQLGRSRQVYVAEAAGLSPALFNRLVRESGAFVATRPGVQIDLNGNFACVHCLVPGRYEIRLPDGRREALDLVAGETRWLTR